MSIFAKKFNWNICPLFSQGYSSLLVEKWLPGQLLYPLLPLPTLRHQSLSPCYIFLMVFGFFFFFFFFSSKQSSTHTTQLRLYSCCHQCDDTASAGPPLQGEGDLRGSETAPGFWGPWDRLGPPQSPSHPGATQPAHTRMVHSLPTSGSHHRPRLCPW